MNLKNEIPRFDSVPNCISKAVLSGPKLWQCSLLSDYLLLDIQKYLMQNKSVSVKSILYIIAYQNN